MSAVLLAVMFVCLSVSIVCLMSCHCAVWLLDVQLRAAAAWDAELRPTPHMLCCAGGGGRPPAADQHGLPHRAGVLAARQDVHLQGGLRVLPALLHAVPPLPGEASVTNLSRLARVLARNLPVVRSW